MSNLLKSKFLLGVMIVAVLLVGAVAFSAPSQAAAASCTITTTLRVGSKGADVKCLQSALSLIADGSFGPKTKAAVVAWQKSMGLVADGVFGPKSRAAWTGGTVSMTYPAGCTSGTGFSSTTGLPCTGTVTTTYPAGCTSASGYSPTTGANCATGVTVSQTGPVSAMLSSDTPASGYIISNQATADMAHFTLSGSGTVTSVSLHRSGISNQNVLTNVYLFDGTTRLTDGFSFNNTGDLTMNGLSIAVNGSKVISVKADVENNATVDGSTIGINLTSFTALGNAPTTANVMGNTMYIGTGSAATVLLQAQTVGIVGGNLCTLGLNCPSVNAGTTAFTVWSAPVQVNTRAVWLKGANFRIVGSAPVTALSNLHLYVDGVSTGAAANMVSITGSNYAMFDFTASPLSLTTGTHTLDLRADIVAGSSYTVQVSIQQAADLVLFDSQVGVNIAANGLTAGSAFAVNAAGTITINAGSASVVVDPTFQAMTNITGGATNVAIGKFKIHGYGEDVKVSSLSVTPVFTGATVPVQNCPTACGLNNVTVFFNGSQVGSSANWTNAASIPFNLGSQMILSAGVDSYIEIRADLQSSASINYTGGVVSTNLNVGANNAQGQTSHTTLNFPGSTITGTSLSVQTGVLAVAANASYLAQTINPNTPNTKIASFTLQNQSSSEGVRVTNLSVALAFAAPTFTLGGSTTNVQAAGQTWNVSSTAGFTVGNIITLAANAGCSTLPIGTITAVTAPTTLTVTVSTPSNVNTCTTATAVVGSGITSGPATITNVSNLRTTETSGSGANPIQPSGTNNFSVNFTLLPGESRNIDIVGDLGASNMGAVVAGLTTTAIGASSNVSVLQNSNGTVVPGQVITLGAGTLGLPAIVSSSTTTGQYVAAGTTTGVTGITRASYNVVATNGNATISELKFDTATNTAAITAVRVGTVTAGMVGTTTPIAYLTGLSIPVLNGGSGAQIDAYASYAPVGTTGVASTTTESLRLCYMKYTIGGTTTTVGSVQCGSVGTANYPIASGQTMTLVGSKPVITVASPVGAVLGVGSVEALDVTFTADAGGPIKVNSFSITSSLSANTTTNSTFTTGAGAPFIVKDASNNPVALNVGATACPAANTSINCFFLNTGGTAQVLLAAPYLIQAGQSQTFKVFLPIAALGTGTTSVSNMFTTLSTGNGISTSNDYFSWFDTAGSNATVITGTTLIYNFPSTFTATVHN